jgi:hypothetical protein
MLFYFHFEVLYAWLKIALVFLIIPILFLLATYISRKKKNKIGINQKSSSPQD